MSNPKNNNHRVDNDDCDHDHDSQIPIISTRSSNSSKHQHQRPIINSNSGGNDNDSHHSPASSHQNRCAGYFNSEEGGAGLKRKQHLQERERIINALLQKENKKQRDKQHQRQQQRRKQQIKKSCPIGTNTPLSRHIFSETPKGNSAKNSSNESHEPSSHNKNDTSPSSSQSQHLRGPQLPSSSSNDIQNTYKPPSLLPNSNNSSQTLHMKTSDYNTKYDGGTSFSFSFNPPAADPPPKLQEHYQQLSTKLPLVAESTPCPPNPPHYAQSNIHPSRDHSTSRCCDVPMKLPSSFSSNNKQENNSSNSDKISPPPHPVLIPNSAASSFTVTISNCNDNNSLTRQQQQQQQPLTQEENIRLFSSSPSSSSNALSYSPLSCLFSHSASSSKVSSSSRKQDQDQSESILSHSMYTAEDTTYVGGTGGAATLNDPRFANKECSLQQKQRKGNVQPAAFDREDSTRRTSTHETETTSFHEHSLSYTDGEERKFVLVDGSSNSADTKSSVVLVYSETIGGWKMKFDTETADKLGRQNGNQRDPSLSRRGISEVQWKRFKRKRQICWAAVCVGIMLVVFAVMMIGISVGMVSNTKQRQEEQVQVNDGGSDGAFGITAPFTSQMPSIRMAQTTSPRPSLNPNIEYIAKRPEAHNIFQHGEISPPATVPFVAQQQPTTTAEQYSNKDQDVIDQNSLLRRAVNSYFRLQTTTPLVTETIHSTLVAETASYGSPDIGSWNVSLVTDFSNLFDARRNPGALWFNQDLSSWDVARATSMKEMFFEASLFNQNLSSWKIGRVTSMRSMFAGAEQFGGAGLGAWNVSRVKELDYMFKQARSFQGGDIGRWNVESAITMRSMFQGASTFDENLNNWNVQRVKDLSFMFSGAESFRGELALWDVSNVVDMTSMFLKASKFDADLAIWDVSAVTKMSKTFKAAKSFKGGNLISWDVSNVRDMSNMFSKASIFNSDITLWNVSQVTSMSKTFHRAGAFNIDLSSWDVSQVTDMFSMFYEASSFNQDLSGWNVGNVGLANMFSNASNFNNNLCRWGNRLSPHSDVTDMFSGSGCPLKQSPQFQSNPAGPFCYNCSVNIR